MDPISIVGLVASSIAIVQAADRIGGLLGTLKPLFEAPREVEQLIKDVKSLKSLIIDVSEAAKEMDRSKILPAEKLGTLKGFVDDAEDILTELHRLIETFIKPSKSTEGRLKVHRGTWTRKVGEVEKLRNRMRELRLSVAVELSSLHLFAVVRSSQSLDQITLQAGQLLSEHSTTQQFLLQEFPEHRNMLCQLLEIQQSASIGSFHNMDETGSDVAQLTAANHPDPAVTLQNLRQKVESRYACDPNCLCACHIPYQAGISTKWTGSVSMRISGLPYVTRTCSIESCKKRSKTRLQVHLGFPKWILSRVLTISILCGSFAKPQFTFRTLRVRDGGDPIFFYAQTGNLNGIKRLFANSEASILDVNKWNQSALSLAMYHFQYHVAEFLLDQNSDPFLEDADRRTPISVAWEIFYFRNIDQEIKQSIPRLFPRLFDDERCNHRMSKLQLVICENLPGNVDGEIELSKNEIDYQDSVGRTALHWAIQCRNPDVVKTLLSHGADPELPDFRDLTPLHMAAIRDHESIPLLLSLGVRTDVRDKRGESPLHAASRCGHRNPDLYMLPLLNAGADINARDNSGRTPLSRACREDDSDSTIKYLIQRGADINLTDIDGFSPMQTSIQWEHASYVEILLEAGADCCGSTADSSNILHFVALWGNIESMQVLIKWRRRLEGLDVNLRDKDGDTPLDCVNFRDEEVYVEWVETFDELITAILEVQDGATDESDELYGEEGITTDDEEDSQDEYVTSDLEDEDEHDDFGKQDSLEEGESGERFEDALEAQDGNSEALDLCIQS